MCPRVPRRVAHFCFVAFRGLPYSGMLLLRRPRRCPNASTPRLSRRRFPNRYIVPRRRSAGPVSALLRCCRADPHFRPLAPSAFQLEFRGLCPVTYVRMYRRYEGLEPGSPNCVAEYDGRLYSMKGEEELRAFLREPQLYANLELPQKLPPPAQPMSVSALPMLGYMEQTVSAAVTNALTQVGLKRPHYPFLSGKQSALLHVALQLKASNPKCVRSGGGGNKRGFWARGLPAFIISTAVPLFRCCAALPGDL